MAPGPTGGRKLKRIDAKEVNPGMVSEMGCRFGLTAMEVWTQLGRSLEVASLMLFAFCPGFSPVDRPGELLARRLGPLGRAPKDALRPPATEPVRRGENAT